MYYVEGSTMHTMYSPLLCIKNELKRFFGGSIRMDSGVQKTVDSG